MMASSSIAVLPHFNSTLVRLARMIGRCASLAAVEFQFYISTISTFLDNSLLNNKAYFNSTLVRLALPSLQQPQMAMPHFNSTLVRLALFTIT